MLRISNREFEGWLSSRSLKKIPCAELLEIDKLWSKYSAGKYGFTTQRQIWKDCDSPMAYCDDWLKFGTQVGWREQNGDKWHTRFEDLNINKSGVLPFEMHVAESARSLWSIVGWNDCGIWGVSHISLRLEECEL